MDLKCVIYMFMWLPYVPHKMPFWTACGRGPWFSQPCFEVFTIYFKGAQGLLFCMK